VFVSLCQTVQEEQSGEVLQILYRSNVKKTFGSAERLLQEHPRFCREVANILSHKSIKEKETQRERSAHTSCACS